MADEADDIVFERMDDLVRNCGRSRASLYNDIRAGLMTPMVVLGPNCTAIPRHERQAVMSARLAGKSDDEIRQLVVRLVSKRSELFERFAGAA